MYGASPPPGRTGDRPVADGRPASCLAAFVRRQTRNWQSLPARPRPDSCVHAAAVYLSLARHQIRPEERSMMERPKMIDAVEVRSEVDIPGDELAAMREQVASLDRYTDEPIIGVRLTLRPGPGRTKNRYVADAHVVFEGRVLAAHVAGPESAPRRPRRPSSGCGASCAGSSGAEVARRNEPRRDPQGARGPRSPTPPTAPRPSSSRRRSARSCGAGPTPRSPRRTLEAVSEMLDLDEEFHLFVARPDRRGRRRPLARRRARGPDPSPRQRARRRDRRHRRGGAELVLGAA